MVHHVVMSTGDVPNVDYSANVETYPLVAHTLLKTIPAASSTARSVVEIQNRSTATLRLAVFSVDGTQRTIYSLRPASAQYAGDGGAWFSYDEKGKIEIYGPAGTETVAARVA